LSEDHISYHTTVRGPDISRNAIVSGYIPIYQINTCFAKVLSYSSIVDKNGFAGRIWLAGLSLETPGLYELDRQSQPSRQRCHFWKLHDQLVLRPIFCYLHPLGRTKYTATMVQLRDQNVPRKIRRESCWPRPHNGLEFDQTLSCVILFQAWLGYILLRSQKKI